MPGSTWSSSATVLADLERIEADLHLTGGARDRARVAGEVRIGALLDGGARHPHRRAAAPARRASRAAGAAPRERAVGDRSRSSHRASATSASCTDGAASPSRCPSTSSRRPCSRMSRTSSCARDHPLAGRTELTPVDLADRGVDRDLRLDDLPSVAAAAVRRRLERAAHRARVDGVREPPRARARGPRGRARAAHGRGRRCIPISWRSRPCARRRPATSRRCTAAARPTRPRCRPCSTRSWSTRARCDRADDQAMARTQSGSGRARIPRSGGERTATSGATAKTTVTTRRRAWCALTTLARFTPSTTCGRSAPSARRRAGPRHPEPARRPRGPR